MAEIPPLTPADPKGKVILVNFWTFGCINCKNALPYVRDWSLKYKDQGLVVIGEGAYAKSEAAFQQLLEEAKRSRI